MSELREVCRVPISHRQGGLQRVLEGGVLVGRHGLGETDELLAAKVRSALGADLDPVLCVGETRDQKEAGMAHEIVGNQVRAGFADLDPEAARRVVSGLFEHAFFTSKHDQRRASIGCLDLPQYQFVTTVF